jgi:hypothetical protein
MMNHQVMVDTSSLSNDYERLFESQEFYDIVFLVGPEEKQITAHKSILSSRSGYFHAMFTVGLRESHNETVKKPNINPDVFSEVLRYIYCGKVQLSSSNVIEVLEASAEMDLSLLKKLCLNFIETNIRDCFDNELFLSNLSEASFIEILQSDYLNLKEEYLFSKVIEWGNIQLRMMQLERSTTQDKTIGAELVPYTLQSVIANVVNFVRFPLMRPEYIAQSVEPLQVVPHLLIFEAYRYFATNDTSQVRNRRHVVRGDEGRINPNKKGVYLVQVFKENISAQFRWRISNFSQITKKHISSPTFQLGEHQWKLLLYPKGDSYDSHISVFLSLVVENKQQNKSVYCDFTLRIVNQADLQSKSVEHECFNEHFTKDSASLGRQQLLLLSKLNEKASGFLVDDTLYIDVTIKIL